MLTAKESTKASLFGEEEKGNGGKQVNTRRGGGPLIIAFAVIEIVAYRKKTADYKGMNFLTYKRYTSLKKLFR